MPDVLRLENNLALPRCPHCNIADPFLARIHHFETKGRGGERQWITYGCQTCGGVVTAAAKVGHGTVGEYYPVSRDFPDSIPDRPRTYLSQALESLAQPAGSIMLSASAVDAMLKVKNLRDGTLNQRIEKAVEQHLITEDMGRWAHQVRLDANDQRHADEEAEFPDQDSAKLTLEFATALAQVLFVIPALVTRGIEDSGDEA